ncbi:MAG: YajQ family cyclic di-GMP-binding protein [Elusimicrobia bacterium]|nr:YajQ family cyclic di-GMP-binding protein [Candidatus Obscuribacterium magneticum]
MADEFSFDVVSKVDLQAVDDAVNAANREISVRFDFRGSISRMEFDKKTGELALHSDDEGKLKSVVDVMQSRLAKRSVNLKSLDYQKVEASLGGKVRQVVKLIQGLSSEKAKAVVADIKSSKLKVTPSIQGDKVRVASRIKDDLQAAIQLLKQKDYGLPLQFENYR